MVEIFIRLFFCCIWGEILEPRAKSQESRVKSQESRVKSQESRVKTLEPRIKNQESRIKTLESRQKDGKIKDKRILNDEINFCTFVAKSKELFCSAYGFVISEPFCKE